MEVHREHRRTMICVCRLRTGQYGYDSCPAITSGVDEPVCEFCVAARHHEQDNFDPCLKTIDPVTTEVRYAPRT